jgi:prepilin-type N-terminal cleavage/methylation domain-containing protein
MNSTTAIHPAAGVNRLLRDQRGFTLAELMVAMVLTTVVSATAFSALQDANRMSEAALTMSDVNQNLRVAMNILIKDLLAAGEGIPTGGIPIPVGGDNAVVRPGPPDSDWEFEEGWSTLPAVSPGDAIGTIVNEVETDAVTILFEDHRIDFSGVTITNIASNGSSFIVPASVPINDPETAVQVGDLIMWTNGNGNAIQEVTAVSGQRITFSSNAPSNLNQPTAPEGSVVDLKNGSSWPPTTIKRINMVSYYIFVPTSGQITSPHLIRRVNYGDERVVAIGVTNVQLTWDLVDGVTNPTGIANPGPTAADPGNLNTEHQIRKANLFMSARSLQTYSQTGQFMHASLSTNVSLRSLAFVSRYDLQ